MRSVKLLFFLYHFFLCGHGDVWSFSCSVLKEEATFLSCETFPLCGKSRSLFFISNLCSVSVSPEVFFRPGSYANAKAAQVKRDWLQKVHQIRAVSERFHLLPLEAEIKPGRVRRRNVTDTQLNRASVTHAVMSH